MKESWKVIPDYSKYEASNLGRVRHRKYKRIRKFKFRLDGYVDLCLYNDTERRRKSIRVHRLIATSFFPDTEGLFVDHINRIRDDNRLQNLRMTTHRLNCGNRSPFKSLTRPSIKRVIELHNYGLNVNEIAKELLS